MIQIMNKENKIAQFELFGNQIVNLKVLIKVPNYFNNFEEFITERMLESSRYNILNLDRVANIRTLEDSIRLTKAISCNDTIWAKFDDDKTEWEDINPYRNRFNRIISKIAIDNEYIGGNVSSPSPDYRVDGSIDKCWKREDGKIRLYKTNGECYTGLAGLRPYCEYYASQVAEQLVSSDRHFTKYDIVVNTTKDGFRKPYAIADSFTSENVGLVKMFYTKYRDIDTKKLLKIIKGDSGEILREMLVLDSVIMNIDRHFWNYGFLVDNDSFKIKGIAPIYDNDCSLGFDISLQNYDIASGYELLAKERFPRTMNCDWITQAKLAMTDDIRHRLINMYPFKLKRLKSNIDVSDERIKFMEYIINNQIRAILK